MKTILVSSTGGCRHVLIVERGVPIRPSQAVDEVARTPTGENNNTVTDK